MSDESHTRVTRLTRVLFAFEAISWGVAAVLGALVLVGVLRTEFPARALSLKWLAGLMAMAGVLVAMAVARLREGRDAAPNLDGRAAALSALRSLLVVPWLFAVVLAGAGFSA